MTQAQIQLVSTIADTEAMSAFFMQVWADGPEVVPFDLALAVQHVGGYSAIAKLDGNIVGASFGFQGAHENFQGQRLLHSHVTAATVPGVGFALKQHQKAWAIQQGIDAITWTFDPLVRRNAVFNFEKLGAIGVEYLPNFYGTMTDAINAGDHSDRLFTYWPLSASALAAFGPGGTAEGSAASAAASDPIPTAGSSTSTTSTSTEIEAILVELPADIESLRKSNLAEALEWRARVREVLEPAIADGYRVTGILNRQALVLEKSSELTADQTQV
jgi:predicted GNAT superfamily acetyltransferase